MANHCCCVLGCKSRNKKYPGVKFFKIPKGTALRNLWLTRISRGPHFNVTRNTRICSKHFVTGQRSYEPENVDYAPSLFSLTPKESVSSSCGTCRRKTCKCILEDSVLKVEEAGDSNEPGYIGSIVDYQLYEYDHEDAAVDANSGSNSWDQPQQMNSKSRKRRRLTDDSDYELDDDTAFNAYCENGTEDEERENPTHLNLCLLCRNHTLEEPRASRTGTPYDELWAESCAWSLGTVLNLGGSFHDVLLESFYCTSCQTLVRDIDFTLSNLNVLQDRLNRSREKVVALLRNNARLAKRNEQNEVSSRLHNLQTEVDESIKPNTYDINVLSMWNEIHNEIQISDDAENPQEDQRQPEAEESRFTIVVDSSNSKHSTSLRSSRRPADADSDTTTSSAATSGPSYSAAAEFLETISISSCKYTQNIESMETNVPSTPAPVPTTPESRPVHNPTVKGTKSNFEKNMSGVDARHQLDLGSTSVLQGETIQYPNLRVTPLNMVLVSCESADPPWILPVQIATPRVPPPDPPRPHSSV